jgi:C_GCAxxG_C_C family probable redox protein
VNKLDIATTKFCEGYNCAQSVLYAYCDDLHLDKDLALRIACGFGAGMGRAEEVCGAVSGGIIVLGLKHGRGENDDRTAMEITYQKTQVLMNRFSRANGSFICRQLLSGCDITTPEGRRYFEENDLLNQVCIHCVKSVMDILKEIV